MDFSNTAGFCCQLFLSNCSLRIKSCANPGEREASIREPPGHDGADSFETDESERLPSGSE
jgi:hypothetical protein